MQHLIVSHTYGVCDVPRAPIQQSSGRRWIRIPITAARRHQDGGETSNPKCRLQTMGTTRREREREKREVSKEMVLCEKGEPSSTIYSTKGGSPCPPSPRWDYSHHQGGGGSWPATMGAKAHGATPFGGTPSFP